MNYIEEGGGERRNKEKARLNKLKEQREEGWKRR